jgi:PAS domain S-box-containing protein
MASRIAAVGDEHQLTSIAEHSQDAIVCGSLDGTILSWNRAAEELYGYTAAEVIGLSLSALEPPGASGELVGALARIGQGERVPRFETTHARADGPRMKVSVAVSPILDSSGSPWGASVIACDIGGPGWTEARSAACSTRRSTRWSSSRATARSPS